MSDESLRYIGSETYRLAGYQPDEGDGPIPAVPFRFYEVRGGWPRVLLAVPQTPVSIAPVCLAAPPTAGLEALDRLRGMAREAVVGWQAERWHEDDTLGPDPAVGPDGVAA